MARYEVWQQKKVNGPRTYLGKSWLKVKAIRLAKKLYLDTSGSIQIYDRRRAVWIYDIGNFENVRRRAAFEDRYTFNNQDYGDR